MIRRTLKATQIATFSVDLPDSARRDMPTPAGTGFFISPDGWFVTAAHVVTQNGSPDGPVRSNISQAWLMKEARPGHPISGMCQGPMLDYINPAVDFALLKVDFESHKGKQFLIGKMGFPYLTVSIRQLEEGEPVYSFGYPLSQASLLVDDPGIAMGHAAHSPRVTSAIVASTMEKSGLVSGPNDLKVYVLDKALNYGNSGGPIVAAETGRVHALCSRFVPMSVRQPQIRDAKGQPLVILIPSLYGVVSSLSNPTVLHELHSRGIPVVSD